MTVAEEWMLIFKWSQSSQAMDSSTVEKESLRYIIWEDRWRVTKSLHEINNDDTFF